MTRTLEIDVDDPYAEMIEELDASEEQVLAELSDRVEGIIHESYQARGQGE